jgi:integrase
MRERSAGYWQLRVFEGTDPATGKKKYRSQYVRGGKRAAQTRLAALVAEVHHDRAAPSGLTVFGLLEEWLSHIDRIGRSPSTLHGYRRLVDNLPRNFLALRAAAVTPRDLDVLYRTLGERGTRSPATVLRFHALLRAAFAQAVRWELVDRNPVERATAPRVLRPEIRPPTVEDVLRVLDRAAASRSPEYALVFRLLAATGCRRGELCGLQWQDVDLTGDPPRLLVRRAVVEIEGVLIVQGTKTHAVRQVGIDMDTAEALRAHWAEAVDLGLAAGRPLQPHDFVFPRDVGSGDPSPPNRISQAWQRFCKEVGVRCRLHDLRHLQAWSSPGLPDTYRLRLRPREGVRDAWSAPVGVPASCCGARPGAR